MANCVSCGRTIPDGQRVCSSCYGDPAYGRDGYYQAELDAESEADAERERAEREQEEKDGPK